MSTKRDREEDDVDAIFNQASETLATLEEELKMAKTARKQDKADSKLQEKYASLKEKVSEAKKEVAKAKWEKDKPKKKTTTEEKPKKPKKEKRIKPSNENEDEQAPDEQAADEAASIFVGNLAQNIDEDTLFEQFKDCGVNGYDSVIKVRFGTDESGEFKRYAHVDFDSQEAAEAAMLLTGTKVLGKPMRVEPAAGPKKALIAIASANITPVENSTEIDRCFIGNLSFDVDQQSLFAAFKELGINANHVMWVTDKLSGNFYGTAFVTFATPLDAATAVGATAAGLKILGRPARIEFSAHKKGHAPVKKTMPKRETSQRPDGGTYKAFFGNLSYAIDDETLKAFCKECGEISSIRWLEHQDTGAFKGSAFADFESVESVDKLVTTKNGLDLLGRPVRVDYA